MTMVPNRSSRTAAQSAAKQQCRAHQVIWLPIAAAAGRAGVSPRTVKRWIAAGLLSATRLPSPGGRGHLRVRVGDLEALLSGGTLE
jgi:Helix-turn-helix domain